MFHGCGGKRKPVKNGHRISCGVSARYIAVFYLYFFFLPVVHTMQTEVVIDRV